MRERLIQPGAAIGVLGGGQLGRMIALAGRAMGYRFVGLDPAADAPMAPVSDTMIQAPFDDVDSAKRLAVISDVVTYEFENVDSKVAAVLERDSYVPQGSRLLQITQDRILEKTTVQSFGIPVAPFFEVHCFEDAKQAFEQLGLPLVLKTTRGGYDGKGQAVVREFEQLQHAYLELDKSGQVLIAEKWIPFERELSVIVARNPAGEVSVFPVSENVHVDNILHLSIVPARVSSAVAEEAARIGKQVAEQLDMIGLLAVELFLTSEGDLYVNELAPRPHNSGHYTMDACVTSQFEQHVRAICNLPLGAADLLSPVVMVNVLGEHLAQVLNKLDKLPSTAKLHLYGKSESRPKRKMGHINFVSDSTEAALQEIRGLGIWGNP